MYVAKGYVLCWISIYSDTSVLNAIFANPKPYFESNRSFFNSVADNVTMKLKFLGV